MTHSFTQLRLIGKAVSCALFVLAALIGAAENCAADLMVRLTVDPGVNQKIHQFADWIDANAEFGFGNPGEDQDPDPGSIALLDLDLDNDLGSLIFTFVTASLTSSSSADGHDFDLLLHDAWSTTAEARMLIEVTYTNLDPGSFASPLPHQFYSDLGGPLINLGLPEPGATVTVKSGFDAANQPFGGLDPALVNYGFTDSDPPYAPFHMSDVRSFSQLTAPFSLSASFELSATGIDQSFGFDAFTQIVAVPVPEPLSLGLLSGAASITGLSLSRRRARCRRQTATESPAHAGSPRGPTFLPTDSPALQAPNSAPRHREPHCPRRPGSNGQSAAPAGVSHPTDPLPLSNRPCSHTRAITPASSRTLPGGDRNPADSVNESRSGRRGVSGQDSSRPVGDYGFF